MQRLYKTSLYRLIPALLLLWLFSLQNGIGQDFHLAQYDAAPQYLNPALTGIYFKDKGDYRINANYRSQWRSLVNKPFHTYCIGYDMPYKRFGFGGFIINNRAGTGSFNTLSFMASGAYQITDDPTKRHFMTVGLQLGILHKSYDPTKHTFDEQYSVQAGGFDPNLDNGEVFDKTSILRFDVNGGIYYKYVDMDKTFNPYGGFSVRHINKPNESFTSNKTRLPMHFIAHGGTDIIINEKIKIVPSVLYMINNSKGKKYNNKATELNMGLLGYYRFEESDYEVFLGGAYRLEDAVIIHTGLKHDNNIYRISYDINASYLHNFSGGRGALEFSIIYTGFRKERVRTKESYL